MGKVAVKRFAGRRFAQRPEYMTASESVQKELALTDDQKAQLKKLRTI